MKGDASHVPPPGTLAHEVIVLDKSNFQGTRGKRRTTGVHYLVYTADLCQSHEYDESCEEIRIM